MRVPAYVGETSQRAREEPKESTLHDFRRLIWEYGTAGEEQRQARAKYDHEHYDEVLETRLAYGSPEEMVDRLGEFRDRMGVTGFLLDLNFGGQIPQELVLNSMRLLTEKVMPAFK